MKKVFAMLLTATLAFGTIGSTVLAAPVTQKDGTIFDPIYYAINNPDVVMVMGLDEKKMYEHYKTYGINEGRLPFEGATPATAAAMQAYAAGGAVPAGAVPAVPAATAVPATTAVPAATTTATTVTVPGTAPTTPTGHASEDVPASEYGAYKLPYVAGAPSTKSAYMANLINDARLNHKTDTYIHGYPFQWDRYLADAAQLKAEQYVYSRTYEKPTPSVAWYSVLPQKFSYQTFVEIDKNGGGDPAAIVGYWTAYMDPHYEEVEVEYEDEYGEKKKKKDNVWVEGRYIHECADKNKIFNQEYRYIGVGHVESSKYDMRDYWVILMAK